MVRRRYEAKQSSGHPFHDDTIEYLDTYSNLDVGTEFETHFHGHAVGYHEKETENFTHIVDLDAFEYHKIVFHNFLGEILHSVLFRFSILALVLINSVLIGVNTDISLVDRNKAAFGIVDQIILSIFVFEILLKWMYDFRLFWTVWWNILDFAIVFLIGLAAILPVVGQNRAAIAMVRVVRAFRSLRSVSSLTSLTVVTHTMFKSIVDMLNILFVLIIFMLVMAIGGVTLFDIEGLETERFLSTFDAWFVLFICVTQDGWITILDEFRPEPYFILIAIYLMVGVAIGAFIFANLIVAVVVANLELSVRELRAEKLLNDNPLEFHGQFSSNIVDIIPVYSIFMNRNISLLAQRPLKIPSVKNMSLRRLQAYITLVAAFEQNMLEYSIIRRDFEKIMSVLLSLVKQLDQNGPTLLEEVQKGAEALKEVQVMANIKIPGDTLSRIVMNEDLKKFKRQTGSITSDHFSGNSF